MRYKRCNFSQGEPVLNELNDAIACGSQFIWYLLLSHNISALDENANIYGGSIAMFIVDGIDMAHDERCNEIYLRKMT